MAHHSGVEHDILDNLHQFILRVHFTRRVSSRWLELLSHLLLELLLLQLELELEEFLHLLESLLLGATGPPLAVAPNG